MAENIISYQDMCSRERTSLQRGMNYSLGDGYSVILMSVRPNAPYQDALEDGGTTLIYEGHDQPRVAEGPNPKTLDQLQEFSTGKLTENGKFHRAAQEFKAGVRAPESVRVYEKIRTGIWSDNGMFQLTDSWKIQDKHRWVFKFRLKAVQDENQLTKAGASPVSRRIIPTSVKLAVWARDRGKCIICGAADELHFDHDLPWSKGGTSITEANVQLLCARHNLKKGDSIV